MQTLKGLKKNFGSRMINLNFKFYTACHKRFYLLFMATEPHGMYSYLIIIR